MRGSAGIRHGDHPRGSVRPLGRRVLVLCALLPGCGIFDFQPTRHREVHTGLEPAAAAWVVAEVCRQQLPAADPLPMHAHPPLLRIGPEHYAIRYTAHVGDGFRVVQNGRMHGPGGDGSLRRCAFHPEPELTGNSAWALEEVRIEVIAQQGGSRLVADLTGTPVAMALLDQAIGALRTAEALEFIETLLLQGSIEAADARAVDALRAQGPGGARLPQLTARLHHLRALVALHRNDLSAARSHLGLAVREDPRLEAAARLLAKTRERMADVAERDPAALVRGARERLAGGDLTAAEHWSRRALARSPRTGAALRALAEVTREQGDERRALGEDLLALERFGFDAELVLGIARRYALLGNHTAALRLLLRYREPLGRVARDETFREMARLGEALPQQTVARIRQTCGAPLDPTFDPQASYAKLFRRLPGLREGHDPHRTPPIDDSFPAGPSPTRNGYLSAPGVVPAAPQDRD